MNNTLILGKPNRTIKELIIWLSVLISSMAAMFYWGYISGVYVRMVSPIINLIIFTPFIYLLWRNERKNNFIEANEEYIHIRNGISINRFSVKDINSFNIKAGNYIKYLSFTSQGIKHWYLIGSLKANEIKELEEYATEINR